MNRFEQHPDGSVTLLGTREEDLDRIRRFFALLYREFGHYRGLMDSLGLSPGDSPTEVLGRFPVTTREDYREILQPEALSRLNRSRFVCDFSSGSTGRCVLRLATPIDELGEQAITERAFRRAGMSAGDRFVCADIGFPEIYDFYFRAARNLGVSQTTYLQLTRDYGRSLQPLARLEPNVYLTLPSILIRSWPHLRDLWPLGASPIRSLITMGEPIHPGFKKEVAERLGATVYSFYGTTETGGLASECALGDGSHFDPTTIGTTIAHPTFLDDETVQGELFQTSWLLRDHPVVKYQVCDVARITTKECPCGEKTPRLWIVERTHESFILAGMKLRYQALYESLNQVLTEPLGLLAINLTDLSESEGHTLMELELPDRFRSDEAALLNVLKFEIFELDDIYQFGLVRFQLTFKSEEEFKNRKVRRVNDQRRYLGEGQQAKEDPADLDQTDCNG